MSKQTILTIRVEDGDTGAPAVGVFVTIDLGRWFSELGKMAMFLLRTDWDGQVTFSMPVLSAKEIAQRTHNHGQGGGWEIKCWIVTDKESAYRYPDDRSNIFRIWVRDNQHNRSTVQLKRKKRTVAAQPLPSQPLPAPRNRDSLLTLISSAHKKASVQRIRPGADTLKRFENKSEQELLQSIVDVTNTANNYLNGTIVAAKAVKWVDGLDSLTGLQTRTKELSLSARSAHKLEEVLLLKGISSRAARINQAITLAAAFYEVAGAFAAPDRKRVLGATMNAAFHVGMTAHPITLALDTVLTVAFGPDWPAKMLGLDSDTAVRQVAVWTSHDDFVAEHHIRESPLKFKVAGGSSCRLGSTKDGQCRIHYLGYDLKTGHHQWGAVHYKKGQSLIPGLTFANDEKTLIVVLGTGETIPVSKELIKTLSQEDWISVYDELHGTYYGKR